MITPVKFFVINGEKGSCIWQKLPDNEYFYYYSSVKATNTKVLYAIYISR